MTRMPDFEHDITRDLEVIGRAIAEHIPGSPRHTPQTPAAQPDTTLEEPMSLAADLKTLADRLDVLGEEAVAKTEAVVANPATREGLDLLHALTGLPIDPSAITNVLGGLRALLQVAAPPPSLPAPIAAAAAMAGTAASSDPRER